MLAHLVSFLWTKPDGRRMLAPDHKVNIVFRPKTVGHRRQEAVGIGWQVDSCRSRLEVQDRSDERRVLVRKAVVLPGN